MDFPRDIDGITLEWLRERLRARGFAEAAHLRAFQAEPVAKQGMTSRAHVLSLDYEGTAGAAPRKLLAKFSLDLPAVKAAMASTRAYEREVIFYTRFGDDAGLPTPRCHWARFDPVEVRSALLLDFVENAHSTDLFTGGVEEIAQVIDVLAPFHARWWARPQAIEATLPCFAPFMVDLFLERLRPALDNMRANYRAQAGETLIALTAFWLDHAHRVAELERAKPQTLCHGDLHRGQILLLPAEQGGISVIDWQLSGSDSAAYDLAYLLVSGLRPEQRRDHERELVARYHAQLVRHGVGDYPLEALWQSYRVGVARLAMFYMTAFSMGDMTPVLAWWDGDEKHRGASFWDVNCRWVSEALEDHDVIAHLAAAVARP